VLLAGDFNDWNRELDRLITNELGFHNAFGAHEPQAARTWHARRPVFALDRIWVQPQAALASLAAHASPVARQASDHLPLTADIRLRA